MHFKGLKIQKNKSDMFCGTPCRCSSCLSGLTLLFGWDPFHLLRNTVFDRNTLSAATSTVYSENKCEIHQSGLSGAWDSWSVSSEISAAVLCGSVVSVVAVGADHRPADHPGPALPAAHLQYRVPSVYSHLWLGTISFIILLLLVKFSTKGGRG